ncbi:MAG TPA: alpha/beta fold hydrolase [Polyangiaceae bacterium]
MRTRLGRVALALLTCFGGCSAAPLQPSAVEPSITEASVAQPAQPGPAGGRAVLGSAAATESPFSFVRGGRRFEGVLSVPAHRRGDRLPSVVLVHGSGPMSRDGVMPGQLGLGFGFDFPVYAELARELTRLGYIVARYDKRTCAGTRFCTNDAMGWGLAFGAAEQDMLIDDLVEDAKAAYGRLLQYEFVDARRTVFVGHSQGAQLVPRLLTDMAEVPAGVMLTPPYRDVPALLREQGQLLVRIMQEAGKPHRIAEGHDLIRAAAWLDALKLGRPTPARILGQPLSFWRSWIRASQEAPQLARTLRRPLLVVGGDYDYNVSRDQLRLWQEWLAGSPHRVAVVPCMTHALNCISQADPRLIQSRDIGHRIDRDLIRQLGGFLTESL